MGRQGRGRPPHPDVLTPREWEVLALLREGLTNEQIADRLGVTAHAAKYHVSEILSKLGVASREEAAAWQAPRATAWQRVLSAGLLLKAAGAVLVLAAAAGLGLLAWGVLRTEGGVGSGPTAVANEPTGRIAFVSNRDGDYGIWVVNADGTELRKVTDLGMNPHVGRPQWSPNGERIFFSYAPDTGRNSDIYSIGPDGTGLTQVTETGEPEECLNIRGAHLYFARNHTPLTAAGTGPPQWELLVADLDGSEEQATGAGTCPVDVSPDGRLISYDGGTKGLHYLAPEAWVANVDGSKPRRLVDEMAFTAAGTWSPDGERIALACRKEALVVLPAAPTGDPVAICTVRTDGTGLTPLTYGQDGDLTTIPGYGLSWSPDGAWLLFHRGVTLYLMRADGTDVHPLTGCGCQEWGAAWGVLQTSGGEETTSAPTLSAGSSGESPFPPDFITFVQGMDAAMKTQDASFFIQNTVFEKEYDCGGAAFPAAGPNCAEAPAGQGVAGVVVGALNSEGEVYDAESYRRFIEDFLTNIDPGVFDEFGKPLPRVYALADVDPVIEGERPGRATYSVIATRVPVYPPEVRFSDSRARRQALIFFASSLPGGWRITGLTRAWADFLDPYRPLPIVAPVGDSLLYWTRWDDLRPGPPREPTWTPGQQSGRLKPPDAQFPAAGICAEPPDGETVTITLRGDVPDPRCAQVLPAQRLRIVNGRNEPVAIRLGTFEGSIEPGDVLVSPDAAGSFLAPGVHRLQTSAYGADVIVEGE